MSRSFFRSLGPRIVIQRRSASTAFDSDYAIAAVGRYTTRNGVDTTQKSREEEESKLINTPTIDVSDPANPSQRWGWLASLDCKPTLSTEDLQRILKNTHVDAFSLVEKDSTSLAGGIKELLGSDHPVLESCANYFLNIDSGKKIRPTMVLAISYALNSQGTTSTGSSSTSQKRLAEITEMIHTASLFHEDVIDKATTHRRSTPSIHQAFGNKLAVLGGDFLLSRASISLARLRNLEVVELLSTVIEHLVKGEVMQMQPSSSTGKYIMNLNSFLFLINLSSSLNHILQYDSGQTDTSTSALEYHLRKNFYKTASLMGHSCLAAAVLGGHPEKDQRACYLYGTYVGQAFQLIDDTLDFEGSTATIGKAPLADLKSGLATAPTLFAAGT